MTDVAKLRSTVESLFAHSLVRWAVLSLASAAIIGTAAYSYRDIHNELTAVALSRREAVAQLTAATLAEKFGRLVDVAVSLATRVQFRKLVSEGKWVEASGFLRDVPRDFPHIDRMLVADTGGTLKADVPALPNIRGTNFAHREWYRGVSRDWHPYVSPMYTRTAVPQLNVVAIATPIKSATGRVVGILVLQIRVDRLLEWVKAIDVGPQEFVYVVDSKGRAAFHSRRPDRGEIVDLSGTPVVEKLRRGEHGVEIGVDPVERQDSIIAYAPVPGNGWGVVAQQPMRASLELAARDEQLRRLLTGFGLILLLGAAAIFLASQVASARGRAEEERRMKAVLEQRVLERTAELNAAKQVLDESEAKHRSVIESVAAGILSVDAAGVIRFANSSAERVFGYPGAELLGLPLENLLPERHREAHVRLRERYHADPRPRMMGSEMQLNARRRDGTEFPVEVGLAPVEIGGKRMVTAIVTDISARVAAEERIRELNAALEKKLNELTAANQELAAFSYSVSHDLRAPLRSIDGFSQALLEDYADKLDDPGREHLTRVRAATQRMGHLIDDLLKLSRVTRAEMRPIAVDLSALASDVFAELRKSKPDRRVECHIEPGLAAEGDVRLLRVALENLLGNAWKFTGKTANAKIEFGATRDADGASSYFVRDNGAGFDMVYADKLFGAFQRLHSMDEFPGTGIGLATVQRIVHRHGGQVRAEGVPGQGATFHFTLTTGRGNRS